MQSGCCPLTVSAVVWDIDSMVVRLVPDEMVCNEISRGWAAREPVLGTVLDGAQEWQPPLAWPSLPPRLQPLLIIPLNEIR